VNADASVFFRLRLQKPLQLAVANPSGARLADAVARCIDLERPGPVLEHGAGTGSLTHGLLRAGCPPERIIALERQPSLVAVLREFPTMTIIADDATQIGEHLVDRVKPLAGVVSSLPIKWFSVDAKHAVVGPFLDLLGPDGCFVQLTNAFSSPLTADRLGIAGRKVGRVWLNLLPTQIWSYWERAPSSGKEGER
jgi:phosphatidylethanolamine/phosphatidyl-N-methylethanolamine N-methyltransferase